MYKTYYHMKSFTQLYVDMQYIFFKYSTYCSKFFSKVLIIMYIFYIRRK